MMQKPLLNFLQLIKPCSNYVYVAFNFDRVLDLEVYLVGVIATNLYYLKYFIFVY